MNANSLIELYIKIQERSGLDADECVQELLQEAKKQHKRDWSRNPTPGGDYTRSWSTFIIRNLPKLTRYIIAEKAEELGLKVVDGGKLKSSVSLPVELSEVKKNLIADYGGFGLHLPEVDIVICQPRNYRTLAIISIKSTPRKQIEQADYWAWIFRLLQDRVTENINAYITTLGKNGILICDKLAKKESSRIKLFKHFTDDLRQLQSNESKIGTAEASGISDKQKGWEVLRKMGQNAASSGFSDVSARHDYYLYGRKG